MGAEWGGRETSLSRGDVRRVSITIEDFGCWAALLTCTSQQPANTRSFWPIETRRRQTCDLAPEACANLKSRKKGSRWLWIDHPCGSS